MKLFLQETYISETLLIQNCLKTLLLFATSFQSGPLQTCKESVENITEGGS
jgi:hypothetical protein